MVVTRGKDDFANYSWWITVQGWSKGILDILGGEKERLNRASSFTHLERCEYG